MRQSGWQYVHAVMIGSRRLLSQDGELDGINLAGELIERLARLDDAQLEAYFEFLARELSPDPDTVLASARAYAVEPCAETLIALSQAVEPPRQELLRRLNRAPGGTGAIVRLRRALHSRLISHPELEALEADLLHLLSSWFNPGFLQLNRVDWHSPAQLLEKIIQHEAVHAIDGWDDLRRRVQPDRRCFAFFHPQLPEEPLIFVEVALLPHVPAAIAPLIDKHAAPLPPERLRVAAFYSISNCEPGLRGVSLGNFLIKQVAEQLANELPALRIFCTLSPIPGFAKWLRSEPDFSILHGLGRPGVMRLKQAAAELRKACGARLEPLQDPSALDALDAAARSALMTLCAGYLRHASCAADGDPVARFHLDNGARLERLNWKANLSATGLRQSFGLMVNYLYDLQRIEANHAQFRRGSVVCSRAVASLMRPNPRAKPPGAADRAVA